MTREPTESAAPPPWGTYDLRNKREVTVRIGSLELALREQEGEVRSRHHVARDDSSTGGEAQWIRWAPSEWDGRVSLTPTFPDRPVVIHPESDLWLLRGAEARIYVPVPLWVHVQASGGDRASLTRLPTVMHSDTWWGTLETGELCYWLSTAASRSPDESLFQPHVGVCPLHLRNPSADSLPVGKIALRVSHLSLYAKGQRLWSDEMRVVYQGETEGAELEVAGEPPREAQGARLVAGPRMKMTRGFRTLTFSRLRSLQGWL